jgi:hypothetical protein
MDKWSQRLAKNKTNLMLKNASCKRWDTPKVFAGLTTKPPCALCEREAVHPQPAPGWQAGAAWCRDSAPKTRAQNRQSKWF